MNKADGLEVQNNSSLIVIKINVKKLNVPVIIKDYQPEYKKESTNLNVSYLYDTRLTHKGLQLNKKNNTKADT